MHGRYSAVVATLDKNCGRYHTIVGQQPAKRCGGVGANQLGEPIERERELMVWRAVDRVGLC